MTEVAPSDLDEARLRVPFARPESVWRTALVNRLRVSDSHSVMTLLAPAGYGKTTLLAQWTARDERPFAWVSMDGSADPFLILRYVGAALSRIQAIDPNVLDLLESSGGSAQATIQRLTSAMFSSAQPFVLVLDDVQLARSRRCADVITALVEHVPDGSMLVLAGRTLPRLRVASLRAAGRLLEIGTDELALSGRETNLLLQRAGVELGEDELTALAERAEGWPVGVYLAALALKDRRLSTTTAGDDRFVTDYFDLELLSNVGAKDLAFLTRTAILDTLCESLCDAVLESEGSTRRLESFERGGLFLVPLDRSRTWYRYHREFRDFLRAELERREPKLVPELHRRAAAWCEEQGDLEAAIRHAHAAGDIDSLARLVAAQALIAWAAGRPDAVETWLGWFDTGERLSRYPAIAALGALVHALRGRTAAAECWLAVAETSRAEQALPDGTASILSWVAVLRALMCRDGVEQMQADAESALGGLAPLSLWRPTALVALGAAHFLRGDDEVAEVVMTEAAEAAESQGATPSLIAALAERSLWALARGDAARAGLLAVEARGLVDEHGLAGDVRSSVALAASAWHELRAGNLERAGSDLEQAAALRPHLTPALPWLALQVAVELGRAHLALLDVLGARAWLAHADEILRRRPALGVLIARREQLEAEIETIAHAQEERASTLSPAELRLLPLLMTHRSFREIGAHLHVSRNTVKTQAISIYRKLGVSGRGEAIERAAGLGLVDLGRPASAEFIRTG